MAEENTNVVEDTGFVPGKSLTQEQYLFGKPDFYKDYLNLSGINVRDTTKGEEDEDKKEDTYVAPKIIPTSDDGDSDTVNLLSTQMTSGFDGTLKQGNYYDTKVKNVDLQSMDLSSKSWEDYRKSKGTGDKSNLTRDLQITGVGLGVAGVSGAMIGGAIFGKPVTTPWGVENPGAGMFNPIGNYAISEKYDATKEVLAAQAAFADPDGTLGVAGEVFAGQDTGYAIQVDGQYLVRRPNSMNYIGTLPSGITNQQVLNLEAIQKGLLPNYLGGAGEERGFGVGSEGGYRFDGSFVDANGTSSYYGSQKGLEQLAQKDFNGNIKQAEQWLQEVRSYRNIFGSTITEDKANQIKNNILGSSTPASIMTKTSKIYPMGIGFEDVPDDRKGITTGSVTRQDITTPKFAEDTEFTRTQFIDDTEYTGRPGRDLPSDIYDPSIGLYESEVDQGEPTPQTDTRTATQQALQQGADYARRDMEDRETALAYSFEQTDLTRRDTSIDDVGTEEDPDSGDKIVCTMMNQSYGFGSFRNAIWLKYSKDNLSEEYQKGYHRIFLPLVAYAKGSGVSNKIVRDTLEHIAKHRTLDLRQEMRGAKRHTLGRLYRSMLEPLCYIVGKL